MLTPLEFGTMTINLTFVSMFYSLHITEKADLFYRNFVTPKRSPASDQQNSKLHLRAQNRVDSVFTIWDQPESESFGPERHRTPSLRGLAYLLDLKNLVTKPVAGYVKLVRYRAVTFVADEHFRFAVSQEPDVK